MKRVFYLFKCLIYVILLTMIRKLFSLPQIFGAIALATAFFVFQPALAQAEFDPNNIISDEEILDYNSMTEIEIQELLNHRNSFLATYMVADPNGLMMSAARVIYDRAVTNLISPKFLIVLLQKEQSLIEDPTPTQRQLDWATGYGCPDSGGCNERWRGLWKQINSASLQFRDYMDNPHLYRYRVGQTYTVTNTGREPSIITPANRATAGLYNYTPHVYNGNFNFWNIWQRYFSKNYLNGSLLQASGETAVYLIEDGFKRLFTNPAALTSRFSTTRIQTVSKSDLDKYPTGEPIKFAQYSLIRIPTGQIYLLVDNQKRRIVSMEAFKKTGFNWAEVIQAQTADIAAYIEGSPITTTSTYPTGALLQDRKTGGVYWVDANTKAPIWDKVLLQTRFKNRRIIRATPESLAGYQTVDPVKLRDGDIVKLPTSPGVYVIENGLKRPVSSAEAFLSLGYKWSNIFTVSEKLLSLHPDGQPLVKQ